jgi:hypothetical protein
VLTACGFSANPAIVITYRLSSLMLIARAALVAFTGGRTSVVQIKICPIVEGIAVILIFTGSFI